MDTKMFFLTQSSQRAQRRKEKELFNDEEGADGEDVDAGAVEGTDGGARVGDERFAEEIEAGVDEDGSGGGFAKFVKQFPEAGIGFFFDSVDADGIAVEGETF